MTTDILSSHRTRSRRRAAAPPPPPPFPQRPSGVIAAIADHIEIHGWWNGTGVSPMARGLTMRMCTGQALGHLLPNQNGSRPSPSLRHRTNAAICTMTGRPSIPKWNDAHPNAEVLIIKLRKMADLVRRHDEMVTDRLADLFAPDALVSADPVRVQQWEQRVEKAAARARHWYPARMNEAGEVLLDYDCPHRLSTAPPMAQQLPATAIFAPWDMAEISAALKDMHEKMIVQAMLAMANSTVPDDASTLADLVNA